MAAEDQGPTGPQNVSKPRAGRALQVAVEVRESEVAAHHQIERAMRWRRANVVACDHHSLLVVVAHAVQRPLL